ncbi:hypothetical protein Tco_0007080 [Tanacetum coccineum]
MCNTAKEIWKTLLITHQGNSQVKDNKIDLLVQQYKQFVISKDESIDNDFARFNTIIPSLKALDEGYSSKNYVRKFLRALHPKWRAKVTKIEESKDLTSLSLDELIGNLVMRSVQLSEVKTKNTPWRLETSRSSSREEVDTCGDPNHLIGECPKPPKDKNQRAFVEGSWSDSDEEDDEKTKDEMCLVAQASNELLKIDYDKLKEEALKLTQFEKSTHCLNEMLSNQKPSSDKLGLGFNSFEASSSGTKKIKFMKSQNETPSGGGPQNSVGGPYKVQIAPKAIKGMPVCSPESEKSVAFKKSILGPRPKHIMLFSTYKAYNGGNVIFGSNLRGNIIGKGQICDNKCRVTFSEHDSEITKNGKVIGREMLKKFGLEDSKPMKTLMSSDTKLAKGEECESVDSTMFQGTTHLGLWYPKGTGIETVVCLVYADSDHAGDYVDRKSTSVLVILSTRKDVNKTTDDVQALIDYDIRLDDVLIMCDNKGAIDLSKNRCNTLELRHIEIHHNFLVECLERTLSSIEKVPVLRQYR